MPALESRHGAALARQLCAALTASVDALAAAATAAAHATDAASPPGVATSSASAASASGSNGSANGAVAADATQSFDLASQQQRQHRHELLLRARNAFLTVGVVAATIERPRAFRSAAADLVRACVRVLAAAADATSDSIVSADATDAAAEDVVHEAIGISHPVLKV